jgi:UDP:flavonoid glycosyltransferase YjiC (YdhE family)
VRLGARDVGLARRPRPLEHRAVTPSAGSATRERRGSMIRPARSARSRSGSGHSHLVDLYNLLSWQNECRAGILCSEAPSLGGEPLRVVCSCCPLTGHFHPMLPLADALREVGHEVVFMTGSELQGSVSETGFDTLVAGPEFSVVVTEALQRYPDSSFATAAEQQRFAFGRLFSDIRVELTVDPAEALTRKFAPDLVISETADFVGPLIARMLGRPNATVGVLLVLQDEWLRLSAAGVARHWEAAGFRVPNDAGLYTHLYLNQWPRQLQRARVLDLPVVRDLRPVSFGTGADLPPDLEGIGQDRPMVYVTLGTIFGDPAVLSTILDGLSDLDIDVVTTVGPNGDPEGVGIRPANFHVRRFVPQGALLPRCKLVITHGGAGSVLGPLSYNIPLVLVPSGADQEENAVQVAAVGAGRVISRTDLTPTAVKEATIEVLAHDASTHAARRVGDEIAAMPAARTVVPLLEALADGPLPPR